MSDVLAKDRSVASAGYNRWLASPAALAIHLSIGMACGFSVFWLPLSHAIGAAHSAPDDWKISTLGWMCTLFFMVLGLSAAQFGAWVEREGPRKAGVVAACCWGGGFVRSAPAVDEQQIGLLWLGSGLIGGCGPGLGSIPPGGAKTVSRGGSTARLGDAIAVAAAEFCGICPRAPEPAL